MILHICSYYPTSRIYRCLFESLDRRGVPQTVYVPATRDDSRVGACVLDHGTFHREKAFGKTDRYFYFLKVHRIFNALVRSRLAVGCEFCHAHSLFVNGYVARCLKQKFGMRYIVTVRSTDVRIFFRWFPLLRAVGVDILRDAERVICVSPCYRDELLAKCVPPKYREAIAAKTLIIPNGVEDYWLEHPFPETRQPHDPLRLLYVGQMIRRKNIDRIIDVVKEMNVHGPVVEFNMVGNGPVLPVLKSRIDGHPAVRWFDWADSREQLIGHYRHADIFIMPSVRETFGVVYLEAMSQGLPVIYSRHEGIDGLFPDTPVGIGVNHEDTAGMVAAVNKVVDMYAGLSANATACVARFKWARIADEYAGIYEQCKGVAK